MTCDRRVRVTWPGVRSCVWQGPWGTHESEFLSESSCFPPRTWSRCRGGGHWNAFFLQVKALFDLLWVLLASLSSACCESAAQRPQPQPLPEDRLTQPGVGRRGALTFAAMGAMLVVMSGGAAPTGCRKSRHSFNRCAALNPGVPALMSPTPSAPPLSFGFPPLGSPSCPKWQRKEEGSVLGRKEFSPLGHCVAVGIPTRKPAVVPLGRALEHVLSDRRSSNSSPVPGEAWGLSPAPGLSLDDYATRSQALSSKFSARRPQIKSFFI